MYIQGVLSVLHFVAFFLQHFTVEELREQHVDVLMEKEKKKTLYRVQKVSDITGMHYINTHTHTHHCGPVLYSIDNDACQCVHWNISLLALTCVCMCMCMLCVCFGESLQEGFALDKPYYVKEYERAIDAVKLMILHKGNSIIRLG